MKVIYSREPAIRPKDGSEKIGSLVTTVAAAGILLANEVIMDLIRG